MVWANFCSILLFSTGLMTRISKTSSRVYCMRSTRMDFCQPVGKLCIAHLLGTEMNLTIPHIFVWYRDGCGCPIQFVWCWDAWSKFLLQWIYTGMPYRLCHAFIFISLCHQRGRYTTLLVSHRDEPLSTYQWLVSDLQLVAYSWREVAERLPKREHY